jgi:hypothetical protein
MFYDLELKNPGRAGRRRRERKEPELNVNGS